MSVKKQSYAKFLSQNSQTKPYNEGQLIVFRLLFAVLLLASLIRNALAQ